MSIDSTGDFHEFEALHEFAKTAKQKLSVNTWDYLMGGADTETTLKRNRQALDMIGFRPRVLNDVEDINCGARFLGQDLRLPVVLAPIGSLQDFVETGALEPTLAAADFGCLHMLSSRSDPGLEAVADAVDYPKIFQLYVRGDTDWVDDHISRAIDKGYIGFAFTVDLDYYGRRERDLAKRYRTTSRQTASAIEWQYRFSWKDIERIRSKFDIPLILKGIAMAEDAQMAVEHGIDVIYASNHGGRQLDHGRGGIDTLPEIVDAAGDNADVMIDGGFMRGSDIVKAMALGADAVGLGRLQGLALGAGGRAAVVRMLEILEIEIRICMGLLGVTSYDELTVDHLHQVPAVELPHPLSAFPLLYEDYLNEE